MNLKQSLELSGLGAINKKVSEQKLSAKKVARKVFAMAEQEGRPFEQITASQWRQKWLASDEFVLMEIETSRVATPAVARNRNRVLANVQASANALEPIVVDVNKNRIGMLALGFAPRVIVVDGKHRHEARTIQGMARIMAWVGKKAVPYLESIKVKMTIPLQSKVRVTKVEAAAIISVPRQDRAVNGLKPNGPLPSAFPTKGNGNIDTPLQPIDKSVRRGGRHTGLKSGAAGGGPAGSSLGSGGSSNPARIGIFSDVDSSDVTQGTAGQEVDPTDIKQSPSRQAPGAGVGPRLKPSVGGTKSELAQKEVKADAKFIKKIVTKNKKMSAVAPPGKEKQVMKLKEKFGEDSSTPFKIAWSQYNDGKGKD